MTETAEMKTLTDKEIIEKLLNGASLRTFMIPDESIPSNYPEHIETYDLPHIIINGEYFWGKSETTHLIHTLGSRDAGVTSFCYTNIGNIFCSYNPKTSGVMFMNKRRYRAHRWYLNDNFRMIWDSEMDNSTEVIRQEIESCSKFKIAMLDSEDIWNIHPVDLPMYYTFNKNIELKTVFDHYPMFFRYPPHVNKVISQFNEIFESSSPVEMQKCVRTESRECYSFYCINSNGNYYSYFDIPRKTIQRYKRLKVFVDRI